MKRFLLRLICTLCLIIITGSMFQFYQRKNSVRDDHRSRRVVGTRELVSSQSTTTSKDVDVELSFKDEMQYTEAITSVQNFVERIEEKPLCPEVSPLLIGNGNVTLESK